ncbi:hypothetical protein GCM10028803_53390 [Larkinella knui]|uniref:Phage major capsid protein n=1 Tax=Larkinella knui TaxID=2025310 RepID=A0A3P1CHU6_9BACT|nr:hypothetical protein [Larkinella knui]RRB12454.1 hypothetical protein EHT87_19845 [Larkinella knui]
MSAIKLNQLDASLKKRRERNRELLIKAIVSGWGALKMFRKLRVNDEIPLLSLYTKPLMQPGIKGTFNPKDDAINFEARIAKVRPFKVDLLIDEPKRAEMEASYLGEVDGTDGRDPEKFPFSDFIFDSLSNQLGFDLSVTAVWKGILNSAGTAPQDCFNGIPKLVDDAIVSGEVPEENVLEHSTSGFFLSEDNILDEVKKLYKRAKKNLPAYTGTKGLVCLMSPMAKLAYSFAVEEANGTKRTYNAFKQEVLYFAPEVPIEEIDGLAGTDFMAITLLDNLVYCSPQDNEKIDLQTDYNVRDRSIAIVADGKASVNFVRGDLFVVNDLRARPAGADDDE